MTALWLIVWLIQGVPHVDFPNWNAWAIGLTVCAGIDTLTYLRKQKQ